MSQPVGGWAYLVTDGPLLSDPKLDGLIKKLRAYREANGIYVGDPEDDIAKRYAGAFPWLIIHVDNEEQSINDAEAWIHKAWRSFPLPMAEARARDERYEQCKKCIHFEPLDVADMTEEAVRRVELMNPLKTRLEHGWCLLRGWVPSVAVQIHEPSRLADYKHKMAECWLEPKIP